MRTHEEKPIALPSPGARLVQRPRQRLVSGVSVVAAVLAIAIVVTALVISHGGHPQKREARLLSPLAAMAGSQFHT
jgi:hypothetical protein